MKKRLGKKMQRFLAAFVSVCLVLTSVNLTAFAADTGNANSTLGAVADPGTADTWEQMLGSSADGNRYAGRVWVDKSVYKDGDTAKLNNRGETGSSFEVSLEDNEAFQVIFSALGSSMTTTTTNSSMGAMDVVIVLDNSASMSQTSDGTTRLQKVVEAANALLSDLQGVQDARIAIVTYNTNAQTILELGSYTNGVELQADTYEESKGNKKPGNNQNDNQSSNGGVLTAVDNDSKVLGDSSTGYQTGTNLQSGIDTGMKILNNSSDKEGRVPVMIVLTDGRADMAVNTNWYNITSSSTYKHPSSNDVTAGVALGTIMNASYMKSSVEDSYGKNMMIYGVGVDLTSGDEAIAVINPGDADYGFNANNTSNDIATAYDYYEDWVDSQTVQFTSNGVTWTFNQLPADSTVTKADVIGNINYVDTYYDAVTTSDSESEESEDGKIALDKVFEQIFDQLSSSVFNPISSSTTEDGATGVDDTPLIYVDTIGQYMEIKEMEAVTLFGNSYGITKGADTEDDKGNVVHNYTITAGTAGTGKNPTTNEDWNIAEDIIITVTETDGVQKLEIKINQEILPILLEQVVSETVGNDTTTTITEYMYDPLRVYYTVGLDSDILLPNGEIDISKIQGYEYIDDSTGTVSFYSNQFGVKNGANEENIVTAGDAHVGFQPSIENRYYYHQSNQNIFTKVTKGGNDITFEAGLYGVKYEEDKNNPYEFTYLDYATYLQYEQDYADGTDHEVYTYVSFYRPTTDATDATNAAEYVTYIVYTNWSDLRTSVGFYYHVEGQEEKQYVNYNSETGGYTLDKAGYSMTAEQIEAYVTANPTADVYAVLAKDSMRVSRFHNMIREKTVNTTGTATLSYDPMFITDEKEQEDHNGNDVVVWLGNNGKLTVAVDTGIALTKNVTEAIGNADDTYALTVTIPSNVEATPVVTDANGNDVTNISTYIEHTNGNVLTVNLKAGETVYISGIPSGTECKIGENIPNNADYYIAEQTDTVTVPTLSQVLATENPAAQFAPASVTNAPNKYGNLYITKEVEHSLGGTLFPTNHEFEFEVTFKDADGDLIRNTTFALENNYDATITELTTDENGVMRGKLKHGETVYIKNIPAGATVTVEEVNVPNGYSKAYESINQSGAIADEDGTVVIQANQNATVIATNTYTPDEVSVNIEFDGTKNFDATNMTLDAQFTFKLQEYKNGSWVDVEEENVSISAGTVNAVETFKFDALNLKYTEPGVHSYQILEVKGTNTDITYDRSVYTFSVNVTLDSNGDLVAEVVGHNEQENVYSVSGDGENGYTVSTVFTNYYHKTATSIKIEKSVDDNSGYGHTAAGFVIESYEATVDADGNWTQGAFIRSTVTDAKGEALLVRNYDNTDFDNDTDNDNKVTYHFIIKEKNTEIKGWTYDETEYRITVILTKDESSQKITADFSVVEVAADDSTTDLNVSGDTATLSFTNSYDPTDITVDLDVNKNLTGKTLEANMFEFYVVNDGEASAVLEGTKEPQLKGKNDADGKVTFESELTFTEVGTYKYDIFEVIPTEASYNALTGKYVLNGMRYDPTIYDLVVEVSLDTTNGALEANYYFEDAVGTTVTFNNSYNVTSTTYQFSGQKALEGRAMQAGEFTFALYEGDNSTPLETVKNKADGSFSFSAITYTKAGEYTYTIKEIKPADGEGAPGVIYAGADNPITIKVTVTDTNGVLSAVANVNNESIQFTNRYEATPVTVNFSATKTLKGADLTADMFSFTLYETDNSFSVSTATSIGNKSNDQDGNVELAELEFDTPGTYFFAIVEDVTNPIEGVVYDTAQHNYVVTVRDHGTGALEATVVKNGNGSVQGPGRVYAPVANFENATFDEVVEKEVAYREDTGNTYIDGKQVKAGEILTYFITYTNYTGKTVVADIMDTIPKHTSYVEGSASDNGTYAGGHVHWTLSVADGATVTVSFDVKVDETEVIITNTAYIRDGVNTYTTNEVVNHTVEDELVKDVFKSEDLTVSIDGKKVYEGDELIYKVTFINASADVADITITDKIPANTTYVDGSADNDGVYNDGQIVWTIQDVPAWKTVTVAFKVKVNSNIGAVEINNQATATDGTNNYETNIVTNYTVEDEVKKDVVVRENNTAVSIDGKKVYEGDVLEYTISYKNTAKEKATVIITDKVPQYTTYVEDSADNNGVYAEGTLTWNLEVEAGETVVVSFKVKVNADVKAAVITNKAEILEGKNTYTTNETTNYTVEDEVKKDVYLAEESGVSIDGKKVYEGDVLEYTISYKNTAKEKATVIITDKVPQYTTYVEGSADNDGVYAEGTLTWTLEVEAEETVTVSFKVKVDAEIGIATITNTADIKEGKNEYTTNQVENHTVEDVVEKDVFAATDDSVSIDGKKVYAGDVLKYEVSYHNTDTEKATVEIKDVIPEYTTYVEGSADNGGEYAERTLTWTLEVEAGEAVVVSFKVKVNADITAKTIVNTAEIKEGRNTLTTNEVTNYTVEDEVKKDVFAAADTKTGIDGKEVKAGEELVYTISYKNTAKEKASVVITDKIPQYTTYVEGSADNDGVYAEGTLTWTLEVEAGETVVVSFKVKVNAGQSATITNTAEVKEGKNSYTTNKVSNVLEEVVTPPSTPSAPKTGDDTSMFMWSTLTFASLMVCGAILLNEKKRQGVI